ncbi:MAG: putative carbohydrate kinase [Frankiales bacterium]|nr:putative carbohydrate kinase [Frankiales bacterium]
MRWLHTAEQVRALEAPLLASLPPGALMQRAATGLAVACSRLLPGVYGARVLLLVGGGNNGADALWAGVRLARRGAQVSAVLVGTPVEDALQAFRAAGGRVVAEPGPADLVVDGLVGIGGRGPLRERAAQVVAWAPRVPVVAVDVPSGVDADTGEVAGAAVEASLTVTFGALKPGLFLGDGRRHAGRVELVDIGLERPPSRLGVLEPHDVARELPRGGPASDKYTRGVVGVAAGSPQYTGAAVLSVGSALRAGAGMVRFAGAEHPGEQVRLRWPEAVVTPFEDAGRVQAWVVGPGLGTDAAAERVVEAVLATSVPVLVDADALTICARRPDLVRGRPDPTLLTPHDREFARFGAEVTADRVGNARALAADLGVHVLLKGDATVVVRPDGHAVVNTTGTPLLATAGSGDVLAGAVGALMAQGCSPLEAGALGAYLHGRAAVLSARGTTTTAGGVLEHWHEAVRETVRR